jgi:hypothetical protein
MNYSKNKLYDFVSKEFNNIFDHNMTQIIQNFVEESKELYTKMLNSDQENIVNCSNYDNLIKFTLEPFSIQQEILGITPKYSALQPLKYISLDDIDTDIKPIPGKDYIVHEYRLDNFIPELELTSLLNKYITAYKYWFEDNQEDKIDIIRTFDFSVDKFLICNIKPLSYCLPIHNPFEINNRNNPKNDLKRSNKEVPINRFETPSPFMDYDSVGLPHIDNNLINQNGLLNVMTHFDKNELYNVLTYILNNIYTDSLIQHMDYIKNEDNNLNGHFTSLLKFDNFKELYRSVITMLLINLNDNNIISLLLNNDNIITYLKKIVFRSVIGSISKFYDKMSTNGVNDYIIKTVTKITKERRTSENWSNTGYSNKNHIDILYGSRGMDRVLIELINEIMGTKTISLYYPKYSNEFNNPEKSNSNKMNSIFDILINHSLVFLIIRETICIGESDTIKSMDNIINLDECDLYQYQSEKVTDKDIINFTYNESFKYFKTYCDKLVEIFIGLLYGTFILKHIYDIKEKIKDTNTFSKKEYTYFVGLATSGYNLITKNIKEIRKILRFVLKDNNDCIGYYPKTYKHFFDTKNDDKYNESLLESMLPESNLEKLKFRNVFTRIIKIPVLYKLFKNAEHILYEIENSMNYTYDNPSVTEVSFESCESLINKLFSKEHVNFINKFIGPTRLQGTIKDYCKNLKKDTVIALETEDSELYDECIKKSMVINDIKYKNPSQDDIQCINDTLSFVTDGLESIEL